jgi:hypothetical protein
MWRLVRYRNGEYHITNIYNKKVMDVSQGRDVEGQKVHAWNRHNGANQRWRIVYTKDVRKDTRTSMWGFRVNTPFYVQSRLPHRRVLKCVGASNVTLNKLVRNTQY